MMVPVDRRITLEEIKVHRWFAVGLDEKFEEDWDYKQTRETTPEVIAMHPWPLSACFLCNKIKHTIRKPFMALRNLPLRQNLKMRH